jgi:predicted DNA-binding transcriptional regulator AlpA
MPNYRLPAAQRDWDAISDNTLLNTRDLCAWLGVSFPTLCRWRDTGIGPAYVRLGVRRVVYRAGAVREWIRSQEVATTAVA